MPTTLLAIDDSVTMRKVLEMAFAGEDYRVVTADGVEAALAKLRAERPAVVLCDITLEGAGGYGLCSRIKADNPAVAVLLLASKQQPYDSQRGGQARADDFIEKPFDTQQLIEKVKKLTQRPVTQEVVPAARGPVGPITQPGPGARPGGATLPMGVAAAARTPAPAVASAGPSPGGAAGPRHSPPMPPGMPIGRGTLAFGGSIPVPVTPEQQAPSGKDATLPGPPQVRPAPPASHQQGVSPAPAPAGASASAALGAAAGAANGRLASQLTGLGLNEAQIAAVLALSREVIEKVVWEVVPVLAETLIQEEIRRLTSE